MIRPVIFFILFLLSDITMALSYTVEVSEEKLQNEVSAMMPIKKKLYYFTVTLSNPEVELIDGRDEVGVFTHIAVSGPAGIKGSGRAKITGALSYQVEKNAFYFNNSTIQSLEIDKVPQKFIPQVKAIVQLIARTILQTQPVYKLKDDNIKHKLAKSMLQSISIKEKKLLLELSML